MNMDRINPRVWLRNWLLKPTMAEASTGNQLPGRIVLQADRFSVLNTQAQGEPAAQPFGVEEGSVALDCFIEEQIARACRPGGVLHRHWGLS